MKFYLGTHRPNWLWQPDSLPPLFVSTRTLETYKNLHPATTTWALDSGGFSELSMFGEWRTSPHQYAARVRRYVDQIGGLDWAAPQDWMCEPFMLERTGLNVRTHQLNTVWNFLDLRTLWPDGPFIPALQGWERDDYLRHWESYTAAGIDLEAEPIVGLGSVCRRQSMGEAFEIVNALQPLQLHGFGMKGAAIAQYGSMLASSDSMAWSYGGRLRKPDLTPACPKRSCANCQDYALAWRQRTLEPARPSLFA